MRFKLRLPLLYHLKLETMKAKIHEYSKQVTLTIAFLVIGIAGFSQTSVRFDPSVKYMYYQSLFPIYEYFGRTSPAIKKEKLNEIISINDITPDLWRNLLIPYNERIDLDHRMGIDYVKGYNYSYPNANDYMKLVEYVSIEISAMVNGKVVASKSVNDKLTAEQKNMLSAADLGTDIHLKIKFKYKNGLIENADSKIIKGELAITIVPAKEAEYPGGFKKMTEYLTKNVNNKIPEKSTSETILQGIIKFTVNEQGSVMDVKIFSTPTDPQASKLLLDAMYNMPKWKPAENSKGIKVKQEFSIPVGGGGGC